LNTVEPTQDGERHVVVRRKGDIQFHAAAYRIPGALHPDAAALSYASLILGHTPSGRLHKKLVESQQAIATGAQTLGYVDPYPTIFIAVQKAGESTDALRESLMREVEGFASAPPTAEEMARTKQIIDNGFEASLAQADRVGLGLSQYIALGDWRMFFYARDTLAKVTADEVQRAAAKYFIRDNRTTASFVPENEPKRADITAAPAAAALLANWKPTVQVAQGEAFEATAKTSIRARSSRKLAA
jgi:zinc protease